MRGNSTTARGHALRRALLLPALLAVLPVPALWAASANRTTVPNQAPLAIDRLSAPAGIAVPVLPRYDFLPESRAEALAGAERYQVEAIRVSGVSALEPARVDALLAAYEGRALTFRDMVALRDALTLEYVNAGYVTSGAVLRELDRGVLHVEVLEGALEDIVIEGEGHLRSGFVAPYLAGFGPTTPVNVFDLEKRLQIFQQQPGVGGVDAQLLPGASQGQSVLYVRPEESQRVFLRTELSNHLSPALGEAQGIFSLDIQNLTGRTDQLHFGYRRAEGIDEFEGEYQFPLGTGGARMALYAFGADSDIVTEPFDELDVGAETFTAGVRGWLPLKRRASGDTSLVLSAEWRRSETFLFGRGFSFVEGPDEGVAELAITRAAIEHLTRTRNDVIYALLELSVGLDEFGATSNDDGRVPDSDFVKLRLQSQWTRRLGWLDSQAILRVDGQLSNDPLLGLEMFPIGGRWSVRGYRENTLIRDNAIVASLEWRVPLLRDQRWVSRLELRPFFDYSYSSNRRRDELRRNTLSSVGVGLFWTPFDRFQAEVYWGEALQTVDYPGEYDLQDDGIHFRFSWDAF